MTPRTFHGVDFSGARLAGRNIWIARSAITSAGKLRLQALDSLESLCGSAERKPALEWLVAAIAQSRGAVWGIDFPFGLPVELFDNGANWSDQLSIVRNWNGGAHEFGLWCVERAKRVGDKLHIRRTTDVDVKTPFDCYHYRIIYQTFHGMRDVLLPLRACRNVWVPPFDSGRRSVTVVEACPGSTLKRLKLPHNNYKQPTGGRLEPKRLRTRRAILAGIERHIELTDSHRRAIMRNPGGDALDALIAAVGTWQSWNSVDHKAVARHARYRLEGFIYA